MGSGEWMQIKWLAKALKNLDDEAEFIASEDLTAARLVVQRIVSAVNLLAETPNLGRPGRGLLNLFNRRGLRWLTK